MMKTHTTEHTLACHTPVGGGSSLNKGGKGSFTHCETTLDIPGMSEDCQILPDGIEAFLLWDQAWMRAGCRGPKPGGFRPATGQGSTAVSQSGKRD